MKQNKIMRMFRVPALLLALGLLASCNDWTELESIDNKVNKPWEQDPALWAKYTQALRDYKQSEHFLSYARLHNSPEVATSEQDFMRCLPDSLDVVSLTNADNFSTYDMEDMAMMHQKGTKVLYQVDYATRAGEFSDAAELGAYLDRVVSAVNGNNLDGFAFTGIPQEGDAATQAAAALIVSKLSADANKLLVFEGNPLFVAEADREKVDLFVLNTERTEDVLDVRMQLLNALNYAKIPAEKLLLAAEAGGALRDEDKKEFAAIDEMSRRVVSFGPLAGLAAYNIASDYYHSDLNYKTIRTAIQTLNPSK